jgi:hypothetical protein
MSTSNLILGKTLLNFRPLENTSIQPIKMPLDTNFRSRIKNYQPIRIQKTAHRVKNIGTLFQIFKEHDKNKKNNYLIDYLSI